MVSLKSVLQFPPFRTSGFFWPEYSPSENFHDVRIVPPCVIGRKCIIKSSTVGPNVTLGDNCVVVSSMLENCIVWEGGSVKNQEVTDQIVANTEL